MAEVVEMVRADLQTDLSEASPTTYCSVKGGDREAKKKIYNAMNNPDHKVGDFINKTIKVQDVLAEEITLTNEETGEPQQAIRVVLIDDKGESYQAVSTGIYNAVKKLIAVYGAPTWDDPIPVIVKQISLGKNQMLTLDVA